MKRTDTDRIRGALLRRGTAAGRERLGAVLVLLSVVTAAAASPDAAPVVLQDSFVHEGMEVTLELEPRMILSEENPTLLAGDDIIVRLRIRDTATGEPMTGLYPAGWIDLVPEGEGRDNCQKKVNHFLGGTLMARAEIDLNVFHVVTLNADGTMNVVDPLFGYEGNRLLDMVVLRGQPQDWTMTPDQERIFVALPDKDEVAVVETGHWDVVTYLPGGIRPSRTAIQPDGRYVWVGNDGSNGTGDPGVEILDAVGLSRLGHVSTGAGPHDIAFRSDSRYVFVANEGDGTVSVIDTRSRENVATIETGGAPVAVTYSEMSDAIYVADREGGTIIPIDATSHRALAPLIAEPGLLVVSVSPDQRFVFALNPETDAVHIVDVAVNRIVQSGTFHGGPDQITYTTELAYLRLRESETFHMIPLGAIGKEGAPISAFDFPGGTKPFGDASRLIPAFSTVKAPGASAMLVANPGDRMIYYYKEGMAAPLGSFRTHSKEPLAVQVVDRSLREHRPGEYETTARFLRPGEYELAMFVDSPRLVYCFPIKVGGGEWSGGLTAQVEVRSTMDTNRTTVGETMKLSFRLSDPVTDEPLEALDDVHFLTFRTPGTMRQVHHAVPSGGGIYTVSFVPPDAGIYYVFVKCGSRGLDFKEGRPVIIEVAADDDGESWGRIRGGRAVDVESGNGS